MRNSYSVLIFDWDGTLMDSEVAIVKSLKFSFEDNGVALLSNDTLKSIIGLSLDEAFMALLPDASPAMIQSLSNSYRQDFLRQDSTGSLLFTGVQSVLDELKSLGYFLCVATGKSRRGLDKVLQETKLENYFACTRCADETFSKPHPLMIEEILTDMDAMPDDALLIGDTDFDLQMGNNAGIDSIAVSYGVHSVERLTPHSPKAIFDDLRELPEWLLRVGQSPHF